MSYAQRQNRSRDAALMRAVLSGTTLEAAGAEHGLTRNRARDIVRTICRDLKNLHRVKTPEFSWATTLDELRANKAAWLVVLPTWENYKPPNA